MQSRLAPRFSGRAMLAGIALAVLVSTVVPA
jgi:hypothetical protein